MRPADLKFRLQIGEHEAAVLEIEDRLAERLAIAGIFDRVVEGALRRRLRRHRDRQPFLRQLAHQIDEALPLFSKAVGDRHAHVVEEQLRRVRRSEEHTSELQSLMRISYAVFCLKKKK